MVINPSSTKDDILNVVAQVFQALGPDGEICAVKCVDFNNVDEGAIEGFRNEISMLQTLQKYAEIVKLHDQ